MSAQQTDWIAELESLATYLRSRPLLAVEHVALLERGLSQMLAVCAADPAQIDGVVDDMAKRIRETAKTAVRNRLSRQGDRKCQQ